MEVQNKARLKSWAQRMQISYPDIDDGIIKNLIQLIYHIYHMQNSMGVLHTGLKILPGP